MIQSPRGLINVTAQFSFPAQGTENYIHQDSDTSSTSSSHINNTETDNQLVWSNPSHNTLNPQIARQLAYSDTLLINVYICNFSRNELMNPMHLHSLLILCSMLNSLCSNS